MQLLSNPKADFMLYTCSEVTKTNQMLWVNVKEDSVP